MKPDAQQDWYAEPVIRHVSCGRAPWLVFSLYNKILEWCIWSQHLITIIYKTYYKNNNNNNCRLHRHMILPHHAHDELCLLGIFCWSLHNMASPHLALRTYFHRIYLCFDYHITFNFRLLLALARIVVMEWQRALNGLIDFLLFFLV